MTSVSGGDRDHPAAATASSAGGGAERCPRCGSHNTKFCYYNNYNLAQPRHFCKACRRYWTLGGSLRDVPIGGSTRSTARSSKQQTSGRPGTVTAAPSSSSRRRLLPTQAPAPATTYASPDTSSSNSLESGAPSVVPISVVPYTESTASDVSGAAMDEEGLFTPLLAEPPPAGFMALHDLFLHGFDAGDHLSFGMGTGAAAWPSFGEDSGAGLMVGGNSEAGGAKLVGGNGGDCFGWPEMGMSAAPGERRGLQ